ncbi:MULTISPECIES: hypothetical protein [Brevibacterium]|jgi:YHS domain-containing protein|uniref:YHS domain-containing protein n=1 Tax=Brevibacterium permense TaxID=234834 RepID=A0ABP4KMR9_9MICO|nr:MULTISPECIES: hypothetical protein [Brevibacterium]UZD60971.1 hypothetical protein LJ362_09675 [Brevibacterium sp. JSBI002]
MSNEDQASTSCCSTSPAAKASAAEEPVSDGSSCGGMIGAENPAADSGHRDNLLVEGSDDDMTTCPVMVGNPVNKQDAEEKGLFRDYYGQRFWLCCPGCGPTFDSDPAKYAANMA